MGPLKTFNPQHCIYLQILLSSDATTNKSRFSTKTDLNREMLLVCSEADDI